MASRASRALSALRAYDASAGAGADADVDAGADADDDASPSRRRSIINIDYFSASSASSRASSQAASPVASPAASSPTHRGGGGGGGGGGSGGGSTAGGDGGGLLPGEVAVTSPDMSKRRILCFVLATVLVIAIAGGLIAASWRPGVGVGVGMNQTDAG